LCCPTNRWQVKWRDIDTEALNACFAREAHLFSAVRHFMLAKDYAAPEAASEGYAPFYMREIDHLIPSEQGQIDEIRCHATLCKRNLGQKPPGCTFQANRALPRARFMIQTRQNIEEMTGSFDCV
jgi:hypothetical protein